MTLQRRVLLRVFGLLTLLIVSVCVTAAVFSIKEHREMVKNSFRAQALSLVDQVERLLLWDDRVGLKALLVRLTHDDIRRWRRIACARQGIININPIESRISN